MNYALAARRMIFENHNDTEAPFTNDQILDEMKEAGLVADSVTIDDVEDVFVNLCGAGLARNIAQNFTTVWLKLFDVMTEDDCTSCGKIWLGGMEDRACPGCGGSI